MPGKLPRWLARALVAAAIVAIPLSLLGGRYVRLGADWVDADTCVGCHRQQNPQLVRQWIGSAHFDARVGCEGCHGEDHEAMFGVDGAVSSKVCAECHAQAYEEFSRSGHATTLADATGNGRFLAAPGAIQRQGCISCHAIGRSFPDGGQGQCNFCHTGHRFSAAEAREPRACEGCHLGPDHPQMEAWKASKHGVVWQSLRDDTTAPTCVACHLGGAAGHDSTANLTLGRVASGAVLEGTPAPVPMKTITRAEFDERRARMIETCAPCHSSGFAARHLRDADEIKIIADGLLAEAADIIRGLERDGLLDPMPADRPPHPIAGHTVVLGGHQLYSDTSAIEQRFFEMSKFHHSVAFKGAYHFSPDHTHWVGYFGLQRDLTFVRGEARRLRAEAARRAPAPDPAPAPELVDAP